MVALPSLTLTENPDVISGPETVTTLPLAVALCPDMSQFPVLLAVHSLILEAIRLATSLSVLLILVLSGEMSFVSVPLALILLILTLLLLVIVMVALAFAKPEVMLAAVLQRLTTAELPLKPLTAVHCTLVEGVQVPDVTTDQLALATPVAGAVPHTPAVLLQRISTLLSVPCKVLVSCLVCVCDCWICRVFLLMVAPSYMGLGAVPS